MSRSVIIIPTLGNEDQTLAALRCAQAQTGVGKPLILLIQQGGSVDFTDYARETADWIVRVWRHVPPLPSLSATWNRALDYAWEIGAEDALVINNDVELVQEYYAQLRDVLQRQQLWFLSGVGVTPPQFYEYRDRRGSMLDTTLQLHPDFSAYLITRACHAKYRFDESYIPAYCEDQDFHRRMLLGNDGRKIGKINLPFLHHASGTLKSQDPAAREQLQIAIAVGSRAHHERKWKGPVNQERAVVPFGEPMPFDVSMDRLRAWAQDGKDVQTELYRLAADAAVSEIGRVEFGPDQPGVYEQLQTPEIPNGEAERSAPGPDGRPREYDEFSPF